MTFDEMYDEMLRAEFGSRGRHARRTADTGHDAEAAPGHSSEVPVHGLHVAAGVAPIHEAFEPQAHTVAAGQAPGADDGPRGIARYRNAAMVGAGGLACAAVGAFLGGLGGYFTVNPAATRSLASAAAPGSAAAKQATATTSTASGSSAVTAASFSSPSGPLAQGAAPLQWLTAGTGSQPLAPVTGALTDLPGGTSGTGSGGGVGNGSGSGSGAGCTAAGTDLGLGCVLGSLTTALGNVGSLPTGPSGVMASLDPSLTGVITDMTGTLANLSSLLPIASLPLPPGGLSAAGIPGLEALLAMGVPGTDGATSLLSTTGGTSGAGGIGSLLGGVTGSTSPSPPLARQRQRQRERRRDHRRDHGAGCVRSVHDGVWGHGGHAPGHEHDDEADERHHDDIDQYDDGHDDARDDPAAGITAAGGHPAGHGGRRLRRHQHERFGFRPDPLAPLTARDRR